ncbi:MAG TPA: diguanylate cyclase [Phycisphaerae bacterium]|nr:diguanylate cyclase [Phycisphaerae bacterium]
MTKNTIDVCVIEHDAVERGRLVQRLSWLDFSVVEATEGNEGLRQVYRHRPKVVICAEYLPELAGIEVCRRVRSDVTLDGTYFVVLTAAGTTASRRAALNAGADEYLAKPYDPEELRARIRNGMRIHRLQDRLERAALTDGLTDLWNHTQFRTLLEHEFSRTRRYGGALALLMIDLDHFKAINDTYGHEVGNHVLRLAARHLARAIRDTDFVARYGGEEFAVICPQTNLDEAAQLADRLRESLASDVRVSQHPQLEITASVGVACSSDPAATSVSALIDLGDRALYHSKRSGRNRSTRCDRLLDADAMPEPPLDEVDRLRKEVHALSLRSKELCLQSIWALVQALDARDRYSAWHSRNVKQYSEWLAQAAGWSKPMQTAVANAAMLHDLGKIGLPDRLLLKPRPLRADEMALVRQVPLITCRILEPLRVFETEVLMIRHIRENFDGSGYPDGLEGERIPIGSRIISIAEAFDAMTCNRAYRLGRSIDEALAEINLAAGSQFDPAFAALITATLSRERPRWQEQIDRARVEFSESAAEAPAPDPAMNKSA